MNRVSLTGSKVWWLLDLTYGGKVYHLSTDTFEVGLTDGTTFHYVDAIGEVPWDASLDLFGDSPGDVSIPFEVVVPGLDVASLIAAGHDLAAATASLSRWIEGTDYEDRQVMLTGIISEPTYGAQNEPLAFSLATTPFEDRAVMPAAEAVVTSTTWPGAVPGALGKVYPTVFGTPGLLSNGSYTCGSPAIIVDDDNHTLLIAGHDVYASSVYIIDGSNPTAAHVAAVTITTDGLGRTVATCTVPGAFTYDSTTSYFAAWGAGGGLRNASRTGTLEAAGDVLEYFLGLTTLQLDSGKLISTLPLLQGFILAGYLDESCGVWEWLKSNLLPILPVSIVTGPAGLYPVVWRYAATSNDVVEAFDAQRLECERTKPVEYTGISSGKLANEVKLQFAIDANSGDYRRTVTVSGDGSVTTHSSRVSFARYGRAARASTTDLVYDEPTAGRIATWQVQASALPARIFTYLMDQRVLSLSLGDVVSLTDSDISVDEQLCIVVGMKDADAGQVEMSLRSIS